MKRYTKAEVKVITTPGGVSGTKTRKAILDNNKELFLQLIPNINPKQQDQIWNMLHPVVKEELTEGIISITTEEEQELRNLIPIFKQALKNKQFNVQLTQPIKYKMASGEEASAEASLSFFFRRPRITSLNSCSSFRSGLDINDLQYISTTS